MKAICTTLLLLALVSSASQVFASETKSVTFKLSLTIPNAIALDNQQGPLDVARPNQPNQVAQTQQLVRNNRTLIVTSIVAQ